MTKLSVASLVACALVAATGAAAMPRDQSNAAVPPARINSDNQNVAAQQQQQQQQQQQLNLQQYVAMPVKEREVVVSLLNYAADKKASDEDISEQSPVIVNSKPWSWLKCEICEKAIGFFEGKVAKYGCGLADAAATAACEVAGLGPEDPLADICAAAFIGGCEIIVKDVEKHITDHHNLCKDIHLC